VVGVGIDFVHGRRHLLVHGVVAHLGGVQDERCVCARRGLERSTA
jgi:hypothetical protein